MIKHSELILNTDGSVFHLHLLPENISNKIILVGDPGRVAQIGALLSDIEVEISNREFRTVTGQYGGTRLTVISTGIGTDNIDIVMNELDALANIDLKRRLVREQHRALSIVRIGTSGSLQPGTEVNRWVVSARSIGLDGLLNFYAGREAYCNLPLEQAFRRFVNWNGNLPQAYAADASDELLAIFNGPEFIHGITVSAPGFYAPQGRELRLKLAFSELNGKLSAFSFGEMQITNFEMESSAIYGLSKMLGHNAITICLIIANRVSLTANEDYRPQMQRMILKVLDTLTNQYHNE